MMKIALEQLPHQQEALKAIHQGFRGIDEFTDDPDKDYVYANPLINCRGEDDANIDIKMETGTGKTYVGVRAMIYIKNTVSSNSSLLFLVQLSRWGGKTS